MCVVTVACRGKSGLRKRDEVINKRYFIGYNFICFNILLKLSAKNVIVIYGGVLQ